MTKKGIIGFRQRQNNANLQFQFIKSETCSGDIENKEVQFFPLPSFCLPERKGIINRPPGKESRRVLSCDKTAPSPSPPLGSCESCLEPPHQPVGDTIYEQWGEGKESNALAKGADDFLNARLGLVLRKSSPGGSLVGCAYRFCFHSHVLFVVQERKFQAVGTGPLTVNSPGNLKVKRTLSWEASVFGFAWSGNSNYPNHSSEQEANHRKEKSEQAMKIDVP